LADGDDRDDRDNADLIVVYRAKLSLIIYRHPINDWKEDAAAGA
jgi:hypothetical protein